MTTDWTTPFATGDPWSNPYGGDQPFMTQRGSSTLSGYPGQGQTPDQVQPATTQTLTDWLKAASPAVLADTQRLLVNAGLLTGKYMTGQVDAKTFEGLQKAVIGANYMNQTLTEYLTSNGQGGQGSSPYGPGGPISTHTDSSHSVTTSISLATRPYAKAVLTQALQTWLGRAPNDGEVTAFLKGLNRTERDNASVSVNDSSGSSTSDARTNKSSSTSSSNTTSTSHMVDPSAQATEFAHSHDQAEAHKYQTSQYMQVIAQMLGI